MKQYQTRQQRKVWGEETTEQKELINLTAQLQQSKKELFDLKKKLIPAKDGQKKKQGKANDTKTKDKKAWKGKILFLWP